MDVILFSFSKRNNSTKRPTLTTGETFDCLLKTESSILTPTLTLKLDEDITNPSNYNYAYIQTYTRYYFVSNWTYYQGLWTADLTCDILASYKSDIANSTMYVLRSASDYNLDIVDKLYPIEYSVSVTNKTPGTVTVSDPDGSASYTPTNPFRVARGDGYYYVKILDLKGSNGMSVYMFNDNGFTSFISAIQNIDYSTGYDVAKGVARSLANPIQYIVSTYWLPYKIPGLTLGTHDINLGYFQLEDIPNCVRVNSTWVGFNVDFSIATANHPQISRGNYLNQSPFTNATLYIEPFGQFEISTIDMANASTVGISIKVDIWTGTAILEATASGVKLLHTSINYGVPIELAQVTTSVYGTVGLGILSAPSAVAGTDAINDITQGPLGKTIGNAVGKTEVSTKGDAGAFIPFNMTPTLSFKFYPIVDENIDHWGRPLCEEIKLLNLDGYIQCAEGDIEVACLDSERTEISRYLTEGFFLE